MTTPTSSTPPRLGHLLRDHDRRGLRFERHLRHRPEVVWTAITESEHLAAWLPVDIQGPRVSGAAVRLPFWPAVVERFGIPDPDQYVDGEIRVWEPTTVFEWDWGGDIIRFELTPADEPADGTRLVLTAWLGPSPVEPWQAAAGWHMCLGFLVDHLDTGVTAGVATGDPEPIEQVYREAFGADGDA